MKQQTREETFRRMRKEISNFVLLSDIAMATGDNGYLQAAKGCLRVVEALCLAEDVNFKEFVRDWLNIEKMRTEATLSCIKILKQQFDGGGQ